MLCMRVPPPLTVPDRDADVLRQWIEGPATGGTAVRRARIVLLSGDGMGPTAISDELRCSKQTVITWRERYRAGGVAGLRDAPRPGRPSTVCAETVVRRTLESPPGGGTRRWTTRTLGADLGVSNASVGQVWRTWGVTPGGPGRVWLATDPLLDGRIAAITGIHLGTTRVLAVRTGGSAAPAGGLRSASGLTELLGRRTGAGDGGPDGFAERVAASGATVLITDGAVESPGVAVHTVPPDLSWARIVQVACWIAAGSTAGAASVTGLRAALAAGPSSAPTSWLCS
jgi:transposase